MLYVVDTVQSEDKESIDEVEYEEDAEEDEMEDENLGEGFDAAQVLIYRDYHFGWFYFPSLFCHSTK